jgi:DNA-binding CsgD family transcriptional regulator
MVAEHQTRRTKTARQMAEQLGISVRSVRNIVAEPRVEFEARAAAKRDQAQRLRERGATYRQIADTLSVSVGSVSSLLFPK